MARWVVEDEMIVEKNGAVGVWKTYSGSGVVRIDCNSPMRPASMDEFKTIEAMFEVVEGRVLPEGWAPWSGCEPIDPWGASEYAQSYTTNRIVFSTNGELVEPKKPLPRVVLDYDSYDSGDVVEGCMTLVPMMPHRKFWLRLYTLAKVLEKGDWFAGTVLWVPAGKIIINSAPRPKVQSGYLYDWASKMRREAVYKSHEMSDIIGRHTSE